MRAIGIKSHSFSLLMGGALLVGGPASALDLNGTTEWQTRQVLSTTVSGLVSRVNATVGDRVARGTVLVEFDPRKVQAELAYAESRREAARLANEEARRELERTMELYDRTLISDHDVKLAEIATAKAEAEWRQAEARLAEVRVRQDYSRVKAPFDGRVVEVHVRPGEAVVNRFEATPLLTLVDAGRMRARVAVDERTLARLKPGDAVQVGVRGIWLDGTIALLGYEPLSRSDNGASYALEAEFAPGQAMELRPGERLVIRLPDE